MKQNEREQQRDTHLGLCILTISRESESSEKREKRRWSIFDGLDLSLSVPSKGVIH